MSETPNDTPGPFVVSDRVGRWLERVPMALRSWPVLRRWYWQDWQLSALHERVDDLAEALEAYPWDGLTYDEGAPCNGN